MVVGRAFAWRRQSLAPPPKRSKEPNRSKSKDDGVPVSVLPRHSKQFERRSRPSLDFPSAVLEAARRASQHTSTSPRTLEISSSCSSTIEEERQYSSPARRRVVDVSDHKTCALLMTRMKEANRQPSPSQ
ncbi:hypothetical protein Y032_0418g1114 [Ancylostoma ceylanicum]|uniref:Uncharacterized protein n=1 Tax=Ancylostoma ceylanicum TaxID=53326 RepID=A0A016X1K1_9BILA|nr:hypothetical protein Y032_0418g1114 [Ancylostoma ceylanicum]